MRSFTYAFTVLALSVASLSSFGATLTQSLTQTFTNDTGTVEDTGGIALFDPALGTLNSVTQTLSGQVIFTPNVPGTGSFELGVQGPGTPLGNIFGTASELLNVSATTTGPDGFAESTDLFGPQYIIEPFDLAVTGGTFSSVGPLQDAFTFNYTPAVATTPEPSSALLLGTGLLGVAIAAKRRFA